MRNLDFKTPSPPGGDRARIARLTRHLKARLLDFPPGGPDVVCFSEEQGMVWTRLPEQNGAAQGEYLLKNYGISTAAEGSALVFYLNENSRFEDLDFVWGCLFDLLI